MVMASLAGGIFLVGFALNVLKADSIQVGILAALPVSANVAQLFGAYLIESLGRRRLLCVVAVTLGRIVWIGVILLPLAMFDGLADWRAWLLVVLVGISCLLGALSGVAWLEWMSDVVPEKSRGAYFGRRNMVSAGTGMVAVLAGGAFLNWWVQQYGEDSAGGYLILFATGLLFGLAASWFLSKVLDPKDSAEPSGKSTFHPIQFSRPFQDRNFVALVVYVATFMFSTQLAGPFYSVYMIERLQINFSTITWLITFATLTTLFMLRIWGPISDQMGNRPVLLVAGFAHALVPLLWVVATPENYFWPLVLAHVASGGIFCALMLAQVNILIKLAPSQGKSMFIAVFNASIGLAAAIAPIIGGWLLDRTTALTWQLGDWKLGNLQLLFLFSGALQILVLIAIGKVREEGSLSSRAVLQQLRNDLNPQVGAAMASDLVLTKAGQTGGVLRTIDQTTDRWAARSEAMIARSLDHISTSTNGRGRKLWRALTKI